MDGIFNIRAEVTYILTQKFSLSQEEVISELSVILGEFNNRPQPIATNDFGWCTRRFSRYFREQKIFVSISKNCGNGFISIRVSIPGCCGDKTFDLNTVKVRADTYARNQLETALEES